MSETTVGAAIVLGVLLVILGVLAAAAALTRGLRERHRGWWAWPALCVGVGVVAAVASGSLTVGAVMVPVAAVALVVIAILRRRPRRAPRVLMEDQRPASIAERLVLPPEVERATRVQARLPDLSIAVGVAVRDMEATDMVRAVDDPHDLGAIVQAKKVATLRRDPAVRIVRGTVWRVPTVARWSCTDTTTTLWLHLPDGLTVEAVQKAGGTLAEALNAHRVTITQDAAERAHGVARLVVLHWDPLTGIRRSQAAGDPARLVVGRYQDGSDAVVSLTDASHIAIQGMTRSGKSALCYTLLGQVASCPWVVVGGIDPNRILLSPWLHIERSEGWLSVGSDPEAAAEVLSRYVSEMDRRMGLLDERGIEALREFSQAEPLLLCVLEEYPALLKRIDAEDSGLKPAERRGSRVRAAVSRLVMEGAKAGIRVVLIAQRMDAAVIGGDTRGQFGTRITLAVDNSDAVRMLHPEALPETVQAVVEAPPGRALVWLHRREQHAQIDLTEYAQYRQRVGTSGPEGKGGGAVRGSTDQPSHGAPAPAA